MLGPRNGHRLAVGAVIAMVAVGCSSSKQATSGTGPKSSGDTTLQASAPGITPTTITIGLINDTTGGLSSTFADGVGVAQARVALQNAQGGVGGRQIKLVIADSQSSPAFVQTAAQELVEGKGVFGIVSDSGVTLGAAPYLTKAGIPVTGTQLDGPEWGSSPNMFTVTPPTYTKFNGTSYNYTQVPELMKSVGAKKVAILAVAVPSAILNAKQLATIDTQLGLQNCLNLSIPLGVVDFTATVLQIKQAGCDTVIGALPESANVALGSTLKNAGLNLKQYHYASYSQATLDSSSAMAALNGTYSQGSGPPAATEQLYNKLRQYDPSYHGGLLDLGGLGGWTGTDAMIEGLKLTGRNPTRASFISNLRTVKDYTIGGLSSMPLDFDYLTGNLPAKTCTNFLQLVGKAFVPVPADGSPTCGTRVAITG
jgi:branched-chain amino acid transport system substrate-binding protein